MEGRWRHLQVGIKQGGRNSSCGWRAAVLREFVTREDVGRCLFMALGLDRGAERRLRIGCCVPCGPESGLEYRRMYLGPRRSFHADLCISYMARLGALLGLRVVSQHRNTALPWSAPPGLRLANTAHML